MAHIEFVEELPQTDPQIPTAVQVISTLFFGVVGILAVIFAFNASWVAGVAVAALFAWRGGFAPGLWNPTTKAPSLEQMMPLSPEASQRSSGNASFDAYRADTLQRLEVEQTKFEGFLDRLRSAKDKAEFDQFMDDRAKTYNLAQNGDD